MQLLLHAIMAFDFSKRFLLRTSLFLLMGILCGCQAQWMPGAEFGDSVNQAIRAQLVNPGAPLNNVEPKTGMDGVAAKASVDNYHNSFRRPAHNTGSSMTGVTQGLSSGANSPTTPAPSTAK